jgi:hypothetical protein
MSWNGSGQFVRNFSWVNDAANNIPITASRVDSDTNDITGNGFGNTLTRDGQGSATANLPMNGFKHTNCAVGVNPTDYATMAQINVLSPLASPPFTGTPTAPTAAPGTSTTQISTTAFVAAALVNYLPLTGGNLSGQLTVNRGILGGAAGNALTAWQAVVGDANSDNMYLQIDRVNSGSTWTSAAWGLFRVVDSSVLATISFGDGNGDATYALGLGYQTSSLQCSTGNNWLFTASAQINGTFSYGGAAQPHIFVQSGTPTALAVGDLWFD